MTNRSVTQGILQNVREILANNRAEIILPIDLQKRGTILTLDGLGRYISTVFTEWPSWGEIIFPFVTGENEASRSQKAYSDEECRVYYEQIVEKFRRNHLTAKDGRCLGSLEVGTNSRLDSAWARKTISDYFNTPSYHISREHALLYSFGLGLSLEDTSRILKKVLLQHDLDVTWYKEAICSYCLKYREKIGNIYEELVALTKDYEAMPETQFISGGKTRQYTRYFQNEFDRVENREQMLLFLRYLKGSGYRSEYAKGWFFAEINALPFVIDQRLEDRISLKGSEQLSDLVFEILEPQSCELVAGSIEAERKKSFLRCKDLGIPLLESSLLKELFLERRPGSGKTTLAAFSKSYLYDRLKGVQQVTRKDILILKFMQYTYETEFFNGDAITNEEDNEDPVRFVKDTLKTGIGEGNEERISDDALENGMNFKQNLDNELVEARMHPLYLRNPFELFLVRCVMDKTPWDYFMASWYLALQK